MNSANKKTIEEKKELALQYLNENYDDVFTAKGFESKSWAYDFDTLFFYSDKFADTFCVRIIEDNALITFQDNYLKLYLGNSAHDYFKDVAGTYGLHTGVKFEFISEYMTAEKGIKSFEEYIESNYCTVEVCFFSDEDYPNEKVDALINDLSATNVRGILRFITVENMSIAEESSLSDVLNDAGKNTINQRTFSINEEGISRLN